MNTDRAKAAISAVFRDMAEQENPSPGRSREHFERITDTLITFIDDWARRDAPRAEADQVVRTLVEHAFKLGKHDLQSELIDYFTEQRGGIIAELRKTAIHHEQAAGKVVEVGYAKDRNGTYVYIGHPEFLCFVKVGITLSARYVPTNGHLTVKEGKQESHIYCGRRPTAKVVGHGHTWMTFHAPWSAIGDLVEKIYPLPSGLPPVGPERTVYQALESDKRLTSATLSLLARQLEQHPYVTHITNGAQNDQATA